MNRVGCSFLLRAIYSKLPTHGDAKTVEGVSSDPYSLFRYTMTPRGPQVAEGVVSCFDSIVVSVCKKEVVAADRKTRALLLATGRRVEEVEHNQIVDLSDAGERWEGDVLNDVPCGWGVVYDRNNRMEYEGFRIGDVNVCWGRKYYSDIEVVEYEGEWCAGQRCGRGVQCDRNNDVVVDGEWLKGERVEAKVTITPHNEKTVLLHSHIEELEVKSGCCNDEKWAVLDLSCLTALRKLTVGKECFAYCRVLKLVGMAELESVTVGSNSFFQSSMDYYSKNPDYQLHIRDCPRLLELCGGHHCFRHFMVCDIANNPALKKISFGKWNMEGESEGYNFWRASLELRSFIEEEK